MTEEKMAEDVFYPLEIDDAKLSEELCQQSAKFAYEAERAIKAAMEYDDFKFKVSRLYATLDGKIREDATLEGRKLTEKKIENEIICNEDYVKAVTHLNKLRAHREVMKARREAFKERGSMLVQLASTKRAEMDTIGFDAIKAASM